MVAENTVSSFFQGECYHVFQYPDVSRQIWDVQTLSFMDVPLQFFPAAGGGGVQTRRLRG